ncbi:hypothetical protein SLEP1_g26370 [Rubroshorea leprosula]|uniref:Uncharacterized protein n=1 Tax=Rubroshorea leprosula TaxID=152421 RepID=A0AAV5JLV5_9ROSI|nr:hypothetical protein SLEP1_g26370 [Rubroshorea leprosula]
MNKFLDVIGGASIPKKKGKAVKVGVVERQGGGSPASQLDAQALVISQPQSQGAEAFLVEIEPLVREAEVTPHNKGKEYVPLPMLRFYEARIRSMTKRCINTYFPEMDCQWAKEEVAVHGGVGVVCHVLSCKSHQYIVKQVFQEPKERNKLNKEIAKLVKKNEEARWEKANLILEVKKLQDENATLWKDSENSYQKRKICEDELEKKEKELDKVRKAATKLELEVHNFVERHLANFLKSSTFENIVNLYQVEVKENGESSIVDFHPKIELKWDRDSRGRIIYPPNFDFKFISVDDKRSGSADKPD